MNMQRCILIWVAVPGLAWGQLNFEQEPINYSSSQPTDPVSQLADQLENGRISLTWDEQSGYLKSLLSALKVPESSQALVLSKTSLQVSRISPRRPRAIYFNDDVYVGWVQRGDIIEVSAADSHLGATFYSLTQDSSAKPVLKRETSKCLQCHGSTHTRRIPGHIVRSVYSDKTGQPVFRLGTHISAPSSPMSERFGGWYVTGRTGNARHMGNGWIEDIDSSEKLQQANSFNIADLSDFVDTSPYLSAHSDITALLVLIHQAHVHNVLTAANHSGVLTERDARIMNNALDRDADFQSDSTNRRYDSAAEKVVKALLGCNEADLNGPVFGTSGFAEEFQKLGPFDHSGRSLRQLDGRHRLFQYPCSFLIHSEPFGQLHGEVRRRVLLRVNGILSGTADDPDGDFRHLSDGDRLAIRAILSETLADFANTGNSSEPEPQ